MVINLGFEDSTVNAEEVVVINEINTETLQVSNTTQSKTESSNSLESQELARLDKLDEIKIPTHRRDFYLVFFV
jgi:hypothetical protein